MDIWVILVTWTALVACFFGILLTISRIKALELKIHVTESKVHSIESDKGLKTIKRVLVEAAEDGEGVFAVKKLDDNEYFLRVDQKDFIRRGRKV